ncbi:MAG: hypothetical protein EOP53_22965 [Sphingobacteriales bacterium]|nr:MAG: hypothetical protein EOP53_22965 [Sphingobacteriales bacterium]
MRQASIFLALLICILLTGCGKEEMNERKLGGVWEATQVKYIFYENNKEIRDSTVKNSGAMYLYDDEELTNQFSHSLTIAPANFGSDITWEGNEGELRTFRGLNIRKYTGNKLELSENETDDDLNVKQTTIYFFVRP